MATQTSVHTIAAISSNEIKVHPRLKEFFGYCLYKSALRMRFQMDEALKKHGLISPHYGILHILKDSPPVTQKTLGDQMGIDKATMVKLLDELQERKLIQRTVVAADRRAQHVTITAKGRKITAQAVILIRSVHKDFLSPPSMAEQKMLIKTMPKLAL